jgi:hypothetical protein
MKKEVEKKVQKEISADMYRQIWTEETGCHCAQQGAQNRRLSAQVMRGQALGGKNNSKKNNIPLTKKLAVQVEHIV